MENPTAILVVIGNEVLSAKVRDENGPYAARRLHELGVQLLAIHTLLDRPDDIVDALERVRRRATWVFTSGGVGPTHDDVTIAAVARAVGRPVVRHPALVELIHRHHRRQEGRDAPEAALRMADVPEGTELLGDSGFPTLVVENVVLLPGVPEFFRYQFERIAPRLAGAPFRLANVYVSLGEERIAPVLDRVALEHPHVEIGSYPRFDGADHRVKITVEARDVARVASALAALLAALPAGAVIRTEGP